MGGANSIPIVSQVKSAIQASFGDNEGARQTQMEFLETCPIISQGYSLGQTIAGDLKGAENTQIKFVKNISNTVDGIPVLGHIKGGIHYACNDIDAGDNAMKSSSRTIGVISGGIGGFLLGGPILAGAGGVAGGVAMDVLITGVDSTINKEYTPYGYVYSITEMEDCARTGKKYSPGKGFDFAFSIASDAILGKAAGDFVQNRMNSNFYRVTEESQVSESIKNQKLPHAKNQSGPLGETCVTESIKHSKKYQKQIQKNNPNLQFKTMKIKVKKSYHSEMKNTRIQQHNSRATNLKNLKQDKPVQNLFTREKLINHPKNKVNYNIKGPDNLKAFNDNIINIKEINPKSIHNTNRYTKFVSRYGGIVIAGKNRNNKKKSNEGNKTKR